MSNKLPDIEEEGIEYMPAKEKEHFIEAFVKEIERLKKTPSGRKRLARAFDVKLNSAKSATHANSPGRK